VGAVVDASICAKWFFLEEHSDAALRFMSSGETFAAPDLLTAEFGNIVWKRRVRGEIREDEAVGAIDAFSDLAIKLHSAIGLAQNALAIGIAVRHSFYDCLYLALAEREATKLVTADRRLRNKLAGTAYAPLLLWIEDLP
jgi:predicted nucleic acid-binding protein